MQNACLTARVFLLRLTQPFLASRVTTLVIITGIRLYHWSLTQPEAGDTILAGQDR